MTPRLTVSALLLTLAALPAIAQSPQPIPSAPQQWEGDDPPLPEGDGQAYPQAAPRPPEPPPPAEALPPPRPPTPAAFDQALTPYGRWMMTPEYGRVWVPANVSPDWQPYTDGRWVFTPSGWSFASTVPWGWATFHYGRWAFGPGVGWYWVPGYAWGPAWVSWRTSGTHIAWAPMAPPRYVYPRGWYGWVALRAGHLTMAIRPRMVPRAQAVVVLRGARRGWGGAPMHYRPEYRLRGHGRYANPGRGHDQGRGHGKGHGKEHGKEHGRGHRD